MTLRRSVSLKSMSVFCLALLSFAGFASAQQQKLTPTFASASATDAAGHAISVSQAAANSAYETHREYRVRPCSRQLRSPMTIAATVRPHPQGVCGLPS